MQTADINIFISHNFLKTIKNQENHLKYGSKQFVNAIFNVLETEEKKYLVGSTTNI